MRRPLHNTTRLPKELREQLGLAEDGGKKRRNAFTSRKERRKAERSDKRGARPPIRKRNEDVEEDWDLGSESDDVPVKKPAPAPSKVKKSEVVAKPSKKASKRAELSASDDDDSSEDERATKASKMSKGVKDKLAEDDAEIAALEKALGIKGKKKLPKAFQDDGLDELLGEAGSDSGAESKKRKREGAEWLQSKRRKAQGLEVEDTDEEDSDMGSEDEAMEFLDEDEDAENFDEDDEEDGEDNEFEGFDEEKGSTGPKVRENPYVAPVPVTDRPKYIPPSLRAPAASESESLIRLRRQAQGLLNKLSEANLISILGEVEKLYRDYPRQSVTSTFTTLLLGLVCDRSSLNDTFIVLHAGFIAAIYKIMGMDFGAELVQKIVETFDQCGDDTRAFEGKETLNLVSLIAQLYSFQVIGSGLMFDYIRMFLGEINEANTELLLKIIRSSGPQLRQDDPSSLKDIVLMIQPAVAQVGEDALSVRTKFMIETITDLKNNRMKTGATASAVMSEHVTRMRKILGSLNSRTLRATEPLRIGRMDILNSSKKGKWWLVGASWKEEPTADLTNDTNELSLPDDDIDDDLIGQDVDLVHLARAHRMNTDVRRAIFIAIMSATDYRDAHLRLTKLRLKRNQELEIPRVLIHCASAEDAHNPYYTLIARKMCSERRIKVSFMFALWDIFKRMGEKDDGGDDSDGGFDVDEEDGEGKLNTSAIVNLAKMYGTLVADGGLTLGILKTLNFAYLQPKTSTFVELLLVTVILQTQQKNGKQKKASKKNGLDGEDSKEQRDDSSLASVFLRCSETPQVVKGLIFFLRKTVLKTDIVASSKDRKTVHWGCKVATKTLRSIS
ncbi:suppressor of glycerol defect [Arachnomyces sp. PD_36]|nr:suppressor of glycerol defect [Arachnomyces sp. PD_36]